MDKETEKMTQKILETARGLFVAKGYEGISMREIAEACDLSKAGLYYHFTDKQDLFLAILDDQLNDLEAVLIEIESTGGSARSKIRAFLTNIFSQTANQTGVIRLASQEMGKVDPAARADFNQRYQEKFLNHLAAIWTEGMANGEIRSVDAHLSVWALLGLMYPYLNRHFNSSVEAERVIDFIESVLFDGIAAK
jgi:AcrR family transcriptional regulator